MFSLFPQLNCSAIYTKVERKRHLKHYDVYIFGGGGLFPDDEWKSYLNLLLKFLYNKVHGGKNIIYGVDLRKLEGTFSSIIWNWIQYFAEIITVRNKFLEGLLNSIGVSRKLKVYPDITFSFMTDREKDNDTNGHKTFNLLIQKMAGISKPYVLVVLAKPWSDEEIRDGCKKRYEKLCSQMIGLCNKCMMEGNRIVFLPFFHNNDRDFIKRIEPSLCGEYKVCEKNEINLEEKRLLFAGAKACISMRFHGVAFSLYHGTPCEAICYAPKTLELMREAELEDYCIKFGIRSNSCFFREFDMDDNKLIEVNDKLKNPGANERFQTASGILRNRGKDAERILLDTIFSIKKK